jgi:hypothetical protein
MNMNLQRRIENLAGVPLPAMMAEGGEVIEDIINADDPDIVMSMGPASEDMTDPNMALRQAIDGLMGVQMTAEDDFERAKAGQLAESAALSTQAPLASMALELSQAGRAGDATLAHLTPGEVVLPREMMEDADFERTVENRFTELDLNPEEYVVGLGIASLNPVTGLEEFFIKKLAKGIKKVVKKVGRPLAKIGQFIPGPHQPFAAMANKAFTVYDVAKGRASPMALASLAGGPGGSLTQNIKGITSLGGGNFLSGLGQSLKDLPGTIGSGIVNLIQNPMQAMQTIQGAMQAGMGGGMMGGMSTPPFNPYGTPPFNPYGGMPGSLPGQVGYPGFGGGTFYPNMSGVMGPGNPGFQYAGPSFYPPPQIPQNQGGNVIIPPTGPDLGQRIGEFITGPGGLFPAGSGGIRGGIGSLLDFIGIDPKGDSYLFNLARALIPGGSTGAPGAFPAGGGTDPGLFNLFGMGQNNNPQGMGLGSFLPMAGGAALLGKLAYDEAKDRKGVPLTPLTQMNAAGRYNIESEIARRQGLQAPNPVEFGLLPQGTMPVLSGGRPSPAPRTAANGGAIMAFKDGGNVDSQVFMRMSGDIDGPGTEVSDDIPAMLSDGEFVMTGRAVRGAGAFDMANKDGIVTLTRKNGESRERGTDLMYKMMDLFAEFADAPQAKRA